MELQMDLYRVCLSLTVIFLKVVYCIEDDVVSEDILIPYPSFFEPSSRHRIARDCLPNLKTQDFESMPKPKNVKEKTSDIQVRRFTIPTLDTIQNGHHVIITNPSNAISVLEPGTSGGCLLNQVSTVVNTSKDSGCFVATNAGFFNPFKSQTNYGQCYGDIISNGRFVQSSGGIRNAKFGIRKDGTLVVGYLSETEVNDTQNPFVQLITGVGWVIRNGSNYLNESLTTECRDTQTTGSLKEFFDVQSARTLIGYDQSEHVHIVQFDGRTHKRGYVSLIFFHPFVYGLFGKLN